MVLNTEGGEAVIPSVFKNSTWIIPPGPDGLYQTQLERSTITMVWLFPSAINVSAWLSLIYIQMPSVWAGTTSTVAVAALLVGGILAVAVNAGVDMTGATVGIFESQPTSSIVDINRIKIHFWDVHLKYLEICFIFSSLKNWYRCPLLITQGLQWKPSERPRETAPWSPANRRSSSGFL